MQIKTLLNGRKIPFFHYFFTAFAKQWSLIDSGGLLLTLSPLITEKSLSDFDFSIVAIKNIISKLDPNEANSDNMISIYLLIKACVLYYVFYQKEAFQKLSKCFLIIQIIVFLLLSFHILQIQRVIWNWNNYDTIIGFHKLANVFFGMTLKPSCIKSSKLPR